MMIAAYAEAYAAFGKESYRRAAESAARFVLERLGTPSGGLQRVYRNGVVKYAGYLEDYAHFAEGSIALYRATADRTWLDAAERIVDAMVERFWGPRRRWWILSIPRERAPTSSLAARVVRIQPCPRRTQWPYSVCSISRRRRDGLICSAQGGRGI